MVMAIRFDENIADRGRGREGYQDHHHPPMEGCSLAE